MKTEEKILICDDNDALLSMIKFKISRLGYTQCESARNGKDAKEMIRKNKYALVISDIHMPFASGLELTTFIRDEMQSQMPILLMSAEGIEDTVLNSFKLGANDFIKKPLSPNELVIRVKKLLEN